MGGGNGRRRALYSPPPNCQIAPQRADPMVEGARGKDGTGPGGPPSCQTGRGRASPCWALSRGVPVLVPRGEIAAQARPGLWHGHGTGPRGNGPGRVSAVLFRTGPVPACWARPVWPTISCNSGLIMAFHNISNRLQAKFAKCGDNFFLQ